MAYGIRTERLCMKDIDEYYGDSAGGEHTAEGTFSGCNGESSCVIIPVDGSRVDPHADWNPRFGRCQVVVKERKKEIS